MSLNFSSPDSEAINTQILIEQKAQETGNYEDNEINYDIENNKYIEESKSEKESKSEEESKFNNSTYTLTFADTAENHKGMQIIGKSLNSGYSLSDILDIYLYFVNINAKTKLINLGNNAYVLVVKQGLINLLGKNDLNTLINEQLNIEKDTKALEIMPCLYLVVKLLYVWCFL